MAGTTIKLHDGVTAERCSDRFDGTYGKKIVFQVTEISKDGKLARIVSKPDNLVDIVLLSDLTFHSRNPNPMSCWDPWQH